MRKYEIMFIVKPDLEETEIKQVAQDMKSVLESNNAKVLELKEMGQRELAYEINKYKTGYYFLFTIETEDLNATKEFDRLKFGIGPQPNIPSENYVLQNFPKDQLDTLKEALKRADEAIKFYLENDIQKAQNKFN